MPPPPTVESLIEDARPMLMKAVKYDQDKRADDAVNKYIDGCAKLLGALKLLPEDDGRRDVLTRQVTQYMDRAENLKPKKTLKVSKMEQRKITNDSTGHSYEKVFGKYLDDKLTKVDVHDAYVCAHHQMINFVRFCELLVSRAANLKYVNLTTGVDAKSNAESFKMLADSLNKRGILLRVEYSSTIHDREIQFNNGWIIKIGRGLDYFKRCDRFAVGSFDQNLRPCHETTIDILKMDK